MKNVMKKLTILTGVVISATISYAAPQIQSRDLGYASVVISGLSSSEGTKLVTIDHSPFFTGDVNFSYRLPGTPFSNLSIVHPNTGLSGGSLVYYSDLKPNRGYLAKIGGSPFSGNNFFTRPVPAGELPYSGIGCDAVTINFKNSKFPGLGNPGADRFPDPTQYEIYVEENIPTLPKDSKFRSVPAPNEDSEYQFHETFTGLKIGTEYVVRILSKTRATSGINSNGASEEAVFETFRTTNFCSPEGRYRFTTTGYSSPEGNPGSPKYATVVVERYQGDPSQSATLNFETRNGTGANAALSSEDYTATSGQLTFSTNEQKTISIALTPDTRFENDEQFIVALTHANSVPLPSEVTVPVTIVNDDIRPSVRFSAASFSTPEGNDPNVNQLFPIRVVREGDTSGPATVQLQIVPGGSAQQDSDYLNFGVQTISFADNEGGEKIVTIDIKGDEIEEPNETVRLQLANPTGGIVVNTPTGGSTTNNLSQVDVTIVNDDTAAEFDFQQATDSVLESPTPNPNYRTMYVSRSRNFTTNSTVQVEAYGGTADRCLAGNVSNCDYKFDPVTITFPNNGSTQPLPFAVQIIDDSLVEQPETVLLRLVNPSTNARVGTTQPTMVLTINSDERANKFSFVPQTDSKKESDGNVTVTIRRTDGNVAEQLQVNLDQASAPNPATLGSDFTYSPALLDFNTTDTEKTVTIGIIDDAVGADGSDANEHVQLKMVSAQPTTQVAPNYDLTIQDNDGPSFYTMDTTVDSITEASIANKSYSITRSGNTDVPGTVNVQLLSGAADDATLGSDFTFTNVTVSFAAGETSASFSVGFLDDPDPELPEKIRLQLASTGSQSRLGTNTLLTITLDDNEQPVATRVIITPKTGRLYVGDPALSFTAVVKDQFGRDMANETVSFQPLNAAAARMLSGPTLNPSEAAFNVQVRAVSDSNNNLYDDASITVFKAGVKFDLSSARAYPVPWKPSSLKPYITFTDLAPGTKIMIYTSFGQPVKTLTSEFGGEEFWQRDNEDGSKVASGVYLYHLVHETGAKDGKMVIIN